MGRAKPANPESLIHHQNTPFILYLYPTERVKLTILRNARVPIKISAKMFHQGKPIAASNMTCDMPENNGMWVPWSGTLVTLDKFSSFSLSPILKIPSCLTVRKNGRSIVSEHLSGNKVPSYPS